MRDTRRTKRSAKPEEYVVNFEIKGHGWLTVQAHSIEEAEDKAWGAYHAGEELQDVEWEVDDLTISKAEGV